MPSKIKKRGENSYLLSVVHQQKEYTKTIKAYSRLEAEQHWKLFAADVLQGHALAAGTERMTVTEFYCYWNYHHADKNLQKKTIAYKNALFARIDASL